MGALGGSGILLITASDVVVRSLPAESGFGYWTAAFDVLMEKHGFLDFDRAEHAVLAEPEHLRPYDLLIVGWLPERHWKSAYAEGLQGFEGPVFLEGPVDFAPLHGLLGLGRGPGADLPEARLEVVAEPWREALQRRFGATLRRLAADADVPPEPSFRVGPKRLELRPVGSDRAQLGRQVSTDDLAGSARAIACASLVALRRRFEAQGRFFSEPRFDCLSLLALSRGWRSAAVASEIDGDGGFLQACAAHYLECLQDPAWPGFESEEARLVLGVAFAELSLVLADSRLREAAEAIAESPAGESVAAAGTTPLWRCLLQSALGRSAGTRPLPSADAALSETALWLLSGLTAAEGPDDGLQDRLSLSLEEGAVERPRGVVELLLLAAALRNVGRADEADALFRRCLQEAWDAEKGAFRKGAFVEDGFRAHEGWVNQPWIALALLDIAGPVAPALSAAGDDSPEAETRRIWAETPCRIASYLVTDGQALAEVLGPEGRRAGLVQRGRFVSSSFQVLSWLVHQHTMPPLELPLFDCPSQESMILEWLVFGIFERMLVDAGRAALRVHAWPWDKRYCLTLRHDVDRLPEEAQLDLLLGLAREQQLGVTWFWIADRLSEPQITRQVQAGQEIALHAVDTANKDEEKRLLEEVLAGQAQVHGESLHVGGSDYWRGAGSVQASAAAGLAYGEFVPTILDLPYAGFPILRSDGTVDVIEGPVGITQTASTDSIPGQTRKATFISDLELIDERARNGGYVCLLNHPDMNFDKLRGWLAALPDCGRLDWTCRQVAAWWHATHRKAALRVQRVQGDPATLVYQLTSRSRLVDLELRLIAMPGTVTAVMLTDDEGREQAVDLVESSDDRSLRIRLQLFADSPLTLTIDRKGLPGKGPDGTGVSPS